MVFITAGMGGGTGTGAAPVIAEIARSLGVLTVAGVTKPFTWEGSKRLKIAESGIEALAPHTDSLIVILNDKLEEVLGDDVTQKEAFKAADDVLNGAVAGIVEVIHNPGDVNVDFQHVRTVMSEQGMAMKGSAVASGIDRARVAAEQAIACPLLERVNLAGARGVLVNITASGETLKLRETKEVMNTNEMYRVLKPDGIVTMTVPYGFSERAFGDMTHRWPPVVGFWFYYLNRKWRLDEQNAPHTDIKYNPEGYSCDFEVTWGYNIHPAFHSKSRETQEFAVQWYKDAIMDIGATLKARKEKS